MICNKDTGPQRNKKVLKETQTLETEKMKSTLTATAEAVINQYISKAVTSDRTEANYKNWAVIGPSEGPNEGSNVTFWV